MIFVSKDNLKLQRSESLVDYSVNLFKLPMINLKAQFSQ